MHWTEQAIKSCLDGTFTKLSFSGEMGTRVVTKDVELDFCPDYNAPPAEKRRAPAQPGVGKGRYTRGVRKPWTPEHDAMLLELRRAGVTLNACTGVLQRGIKSIRARLRELEVSA